MYKIQKGRNIYTKFTQVCQHYLCPPESSPSDSFQASPNATLNSSPSRMLRPSGATSFAFDPGSNVEKMEPKSCVHKINETALDTAHYLRRLD